MKDPKNPTGFYRDVAPWMIDDEPVLIKLRYNSIDRVSKSARFKTLEGARKWVRRWLGDHFEISHNFNYAVSYDGIGKVTLVSGITWRELFPEHPDFTMEEHDIHDAGYIGQDGQFRPW